MNAKKLQHLKKSAPRGEKKYVNHLVVGNDLFSLLIHDHLRENFGQEVLLLTKEKVTRENLEFLGPNFLRGEENVRCLKRLRPELEIGLLDEKSWFFKEQKFRQFGGRVKPARPLFGEEYFILPGASYSIDDLFPFLKREGFPADIEDGVISHTPVSVQKASDEDNYNWKIICSTGTTILCQNVYWGDNFASLVDIMERKEELDKSILEYAMDLKRVYSLFIRYSFAKKIYRGNKKTIFLPLSYTHEWGHFVGEFKETGDNSQVVKFVNFIDRDEISEDLISKRIKILKRSMDRIFSDVDLKLAEEYICLSERSPLQVIDDSLFEVISRQLPNVSLFGFNAPISAKYMENSRLNFSLNKLSHLSRGILSVEQIKFI